MVDWRCAGTLRLCTLPAAAMLSAESLLSPAEPKLAQLLIQANVPVLSYLSVLSTDQLNKTIRQKPKQNPSGIIPLYFLDKTIFPKNNTALIFPHF